LVAIHHDGLKLYEWTTQLLAIRAKLPERQSSIDATCCRHSSICAVTTAARLVFQGQARAANVPVILIRHKSAADELQYGSVIAVDTATSLWATSGHSKVELKVPQISALRQCQSSQVSFMLAARWHALPLLH
jgi:hypothetical protein